ncbi:MAG TPA: toprim domain-containing protein [Xanthobacteraceae bacterium]|nr:toprim domain-containing protein [Xanthobacteraceae bacterium]
MVELRPDKVHITAGSGLDLGIIERLTGGRPGVYDAPCPLCGLARRRPTNQRRPVMRFWCVDPGFATYCCARCGEHGYVRGDSAVRPDPAAVEHARAEAAERECMSAAKQLRKAQSLWSRCRRRLLGSIAEFYLREGRAYLGPFPPTLGYLPPRGEYPPALIAAFGFPREPELGILQMADDAVRGVHLTRLLPDGSDRDRGEKAKIMIGRSLGSPIVLAPANDLLGLAVTEGIEDGLSVFEATGLGVWVAGSASRMPALAAVIPSHIESVTVYAHSDDTGQDGARKLAEGLSRRGIEVFIEGLHCP